MLYCVKFFSKKKNICLLKHIGKVGIELSSRVTEYIFLVVFLVRYVLFLSILYVIYISRCILCQNPISQLGLCEVESYSM